MMKPDKNYYVFNASHWAATAGITGHGIQGSAHIVEMVINLSNRRYITMDSGWRLPWYAYGDIDNYFQFFNSTDQYIVYLKDASGAALSYSLYKKVLEFDVLTLVLYGTSNLFYTDGQKIISNTINGRIPNFSGLNLDSRIASFAVDHVGVHGISALRWWNFPPGTLPTGWENEIKKRAQNPWLRSSVFDSNSKYNIIAKATLSNGAYYTVKVGDFIYTTEYTGNRITKRNFSDLTLDSENTTGTVNPIGIASDGTYLYIVSNGNNRLRKMSLDLVDLDYVAIDSGVYSISCDGTYLYLVNASGVIKKYRCSDMGYTGTSVDLSAAACGSKYRPSDGRLYVCLYSASQIKILNTSDLSVVDTKNAGGPYDVTFDEENEKIFVSNYTGDIIHVYDSLWTEVNRMWANHPIGLEYSDGYLIAVPNYANELYKIQLGSNLVLEYLLNDDISAASAVIPNTGTAGSAADLTITPVSTWSAVKRLYKSGSIA